MYRIDKDDSYNSMAASLVNLDKLMRPDQGRYVSEEKKEKNLWYCNGILDTLVNIWGNL